MAPALTEMAKYVGNSFTQETSVDKQSKGKARLNDKQGKGDKGFKWQMPLVLF